jgi:hypothetical protein
MSVEIKIECLRLASQIGAANVLQTAKDYLAWLTELQTTVPDPLPEGADQLKTPVVQA